MNLEATHTARESQPSLAGWQSDPCQQSSRDVEAVYAARLAQGAERGLLVQVFISQQLQGALCHQPGRGRDGWNSVGPTATEKAFQQQLGSRPCLWGRRERPPCLQAKGSDCRKAPVPPMAPNAAAESSFQSLADKGRDRRINC